MFLCSMSSVCYYNKNFVFKVYKLGKKPAVDRLCLGIPRGEVSDAC